MRKLYATLFAVLLFLLPALSQAQITWDFGSATPFTASPTPSTVPAGITLPVISQGNVFGSATLLSSTSKSDTYAGASGGGNAGIAADTTVNFDATRSAYFEWTLTPGASLALTVTAISFGSRSTSTGPKKYDIRTSLDGFAAPAATGTLLSNSTWAMLSNPGLGLISAPAGQPITIRIYGYGGSGNAAKSTVNWRIDDLSVAVTTSGSAGPIPTVTLTGSPTPFTTPVGTASASQSITVSGDQLTDNTIKIKTPPGFEISADNSLFTDSLSINGTSGTILSTTLFVRISSTAGAGAVGGSLTATSAGVAPQTIVLSGTVTTTTAASVVINQVYGGGGNSGATFANDYIELYNNSSFPVSLKGWSVQYASSTGTSWNATPLTGIIPAKGFYLVEEGSNGGTAPALPGPDDIGSVNLSASVGKIVLTNSTTPLSGAVPSDATLVDLVGYGVTPSDFEGAAPAPALSNTTADVRVTDGLDNNQNGTDFTSIAPLPRNSSYTTTPPVVTTFNPVKGTTDLPVSFVPSLLFNKQVVKGNGTITIIANGTTGTPIDINDASIVISNNFTLTINQSLAGNTSYAIVITAGAIKDVYGNSFAGLGAADWTFKTFDNSAPAALPYTNDFEACTGTGLLPKGFTAYNINGAQVWDCTTFGRDPSAPGGTAAFGHAVQINGFANGVNNTNEDWLISPKFDLSGTDFPLLSYWSRNAFSGTPLQLRISTDYTGSGNPTLAHWTDLNGKFPSVGSDVWTLTSAVNLMAFKQNNVYIAFVYTSTTDDGSRWTIDDLSLINSPTAPPPSLTLSANDFEFGYAAAGGTVTKRLTVTGNDLTSNITVTSEGSFLVSADSLTFSTTAIIGKDTADNLPEPIFIRYAPAIDNSQFIDSLQVTISDTTAVVNVKGNSISPASTLSLVDWNLNWFGTPEAGFGPDDKALQEANVKTILPTLHADVYVLQEVVNEPALADIVANMPGYAYKINNYGSHSNITESAPFPLNTIQKLAFVYNTAKISNIQTDSLFSVGVNTAADVKTKYYDDWASGRYPYMLTADVTLDDNNGGTNTKRVHFIDVHAKANTGDIVAAYNSRMDGAHALDSLLQTPAFASENVIVLGDFNDDLNQTITAGITPPVSSWSPFTIDDAGKYIFPTRILSQQGQHSDVNYTSVIDNVIVNNNMASWYLPSSATVVSDVADLVNKYGTTTTDHYPVFSQFSFTPPVALPVTLVNFNAVKQESTAKLTWTTAQEQNSASFTIERSGNGTAFDSIGTVAAQGNSTSATNYTFIDSKPLAGDDYYRLKQIDLDGKATWSRMVRLTWSSPLTLRISPNPVHGTATLIIGGAGQACYVQIVDLNGQVVKQLLTTPGSSTVPVDVSGIARGIYTVKVISPEGMTTQKMLVQ